MKYLGFALLSIATGWLIGAFTTKDSTQREVLGGIIAALIGITIYILNDAC